MNLSVVESVEFGEDVIGEFVDLFIDDLVTIFSKSARMNPRLLYGRLKSQITWCRNPVKYRR